MYTYTAVRTSCAQQVASTYGIDNVRTLRKEIRDLRIQRLAGDDKVIEAVTTPELGRNRAKTIAQ